MTTRRLPFLLLMILAVCAGGWLWLDGKPRGGEVREANDAGIAADTEESIRPVLEKEPLPSQEAGVNQREPDPGTSVALRGEVRSATGTAIAGARIRWIALAKHDHESNPCWPDEDWGLARRPEVVAISDAAGLFSFAEPPGGVLNGSVLIASHPDHRVAGLDLEPEGPRTGIVLTLEVAAPIEFEVVDGLGRPQAGARVVHLARARAERGGPRYERFLAQEGETDEHGLVRLAAFAGQQVAWAELGEQCSRPWQGAARSRVRLALGASFTLAGTISFPDREEWEPDYEGERRILVSGETGGLWRPLARLRDVDEGPWGPVRIPLEGVTRYVARLEGAPIRPLDEAFDPPAPGARHTIDFVATKDAELYLFVQDEAERPVVNATATVWWGPSREHHVEGASRPDGYLYLGTFPPGTVEYEVRAPGRESFRGQETVPCYEAVLLTLPKAGGIRGRCLHDGEPVEDFEVIYWREGNPRIPRRQAFFGRSEGEFELDHLSPGAWFVHAATDALLPGAPVSAQVEAERVAEVEIEVPHGFRGHGRVVDARSGEAVADAWIQLYSTGGLLRSFPWGPRRATARNGTFDLDAFVLGSNSLTVGAPGYAEAQVSRVATSATGLDWGDLSLYRPQSLRMTLLGLQAHPEWSPEAFRFSAIGSFPIPPRAFDSTGTVQVDEVPPGDNRLLVTYPDQSYARLQLRLDPDADWDFAFPVGGVKRLDLRVADPEGDPLPVSLWVLVSCQEEGVMVLRGAMTDEEGHVSFEGIRADAVHVATFTEDPALAATRDLSFGGKASLSEELRVGESPLRLRVVDREGAPVSGAWITLRSATDLTIYGTKDTDASGWASLFGVPERPVAMDIRHGIAGRRHGVPIDASLREQEFVLDASGSITLSIHDGDEPLSGVQVRIETPGGITMSEALETDSAGRVRFGPLGEGTFHLACRRNDCWTATLDRTLASDENAQVSLPMRRLADLELSLLDPQGVPVSGADLRLEDLDSATFVGSWIDEGRVQSGTGLTTDSTGKIEVLGLPHGTYGWTVEAPSGPQTGTFRLLVGPRNRVVARLAD